MRTYDWVVTILRQAARWFTLVVGSLAAVVVVVGSVFVFVAQIGPLSLRVALGVVGAGAVLFVLWYGSREDRGLCLAGVRPSSWVVWLSSARRRRLRLCVRRR